jgi:hypothetical protein
VPDVQREEKIVEGCEVYASAPQRARQGERTISLDELTGVQALERKHPDLPMQPGHVLRREARIYPTWDAVLVYQSRCRHRAGDRTFLWADPH